MDVDARASVDQELKKYFSCECAFFFVVDVNAFYGVVQLEIQYGMQDDFSFTLAEVCFFLTHLPQGGAVVI